MNMGISSHSILEFLYRRDYVKEDTSITMPLFGYVPADVSQLYKEKYIRETHNIDPRNFVEWGNQMELGSVTITLKGLWLRHLLIKNGTFTFLLSDYQI